MPSYPSGLPNGPPGTRHVPQGSENPPISRHYTSEIDEKLNKLNISQPPHITQPIPTEPITLIDSPKTGMDKSLFEQTEPYQPDHDHQKAKFEAIFKSLDEMSNKNNRNPIPDQTDESPWQLQKQFEQKPPTPEPQRQIPQVFILVFRFGI